MSCARPLGSCIHEVELSLNEKKKENLYVLEEEAKRQSVGNEGPDVNARKFDAKNKELNKGKGLAKSKIKAEI